MNNRNISHGTSFRLSPNNYRIIIDNVDGDVIYIFLDDKKVELSHCTNDNYIMPIDDKNKIGWLYSIFGGEVHAPIENDTSQSTPTRSKHRYEGKTKDGGYGVCEDCGCRENTKEETESCKCINDACWFHCTGSPYGCSNNPGGDIAGCAPRSQHKMLMNQIESGRGK